MEVGRERERECVCVCVCVCVCSRWEGEREMKEGRDPSVSSFIRFSPLPYMYMHSLSRLEDTSVPQVSCNPYRSLACR